MGVHPEPFPSKRRRDLREEKFVRKDAARQHDPAEPGLFPHPDRRRPDHLDDSRVEAESDLEDALGSLKPGDVVYLTVVRQHQDNKHETLKLPVRLGPPREAETSP